MLFPARSLDGSPQLTLELDTRGDLLPRILWAGVATSATAAPERLPVDVPRPRRAAARRARPRALHPAAPDRAPRRRPRLGRRVVDPLRRVRAPTPPTSGSSCGRATPRPASTWSPSSRRCRAGCCAPGTPSPAPAPGSYHLAALDVVLPAADDLVEVLDFTGRHEGERTPQRHVVTDGLWVREGREGRPGLGGATLAVVGTAGFDTRTGTVLGRARRPGAATAPTASSAPPTSARPSAAASCSSPARWCSSRATTYTTPWVVLGASEDGLDGLAAAFHTYERSWPAHPAHQPVVLNVWEAVWFDHDLPRLREIADRAARVGIERFVLDDGWFHGRRDDTAGLGDWWVDHDVWPEGLTADRGARALARHAVRPLVRAGDGQPRLRALPRPPRLDPRDRRARAAAAPQPAGPRPVAARGVAARPRPRPPGAVLGPRRLRQVGPQPRAARRRLGRARWGGRRARADPRLLPDARLAPRAAPRHRLGVLRLRWWPDRPRACSSAPSGCGPPT